MLITSVNKILLTQKLKSNVRQNRNYFKRISRMLGRAYESKQLEPPYNHITQIGDPILRKHADLVPEECIQSKEVNFIVEQMIKVLKSHHLVGVAAPQIGVSLRIIIMEFDEKRKEEISPALYSIRQMEKLPLKIFINPEIKITNYNKMTFEEGCASVKGYAGEVDRYEEVLLSGFNIKGENQDLALKGWNARIAQHEMDHLNGTIYVDKMNSKTFRCTLWEAVNSHCGRIELPFYK